jgi:hypothetical protein
MPTLTITNLTSDPVLVQELYASVPASGTLATERSQADVDGMSSFLQSVADGDLSYAITFSATELAAGAGNTLETMLDMGAPAAEAAADVHATYAGNVALAFPGPFTDPDVARSIRITYVAAYDGGDTTVVGTDQFGAAQSEVIVANAGNVVDGAKIFATVTGATQAAIGGDPASASIGTGTILGLNAQMGAATGNLLFADGIGEAGTWDADNNSVDPTTPPDGSAEFVAIVKS